MLCVVISGCTLCMQTVHLMIFCFYNYLVQTLPDCHCWLLPWNVSQCHHWLPRTCIECFCTQVFIHSIYYKSADTHYYLTAIITSCQSLLYSLTGSPKCEQCCQNFRAPNHGKLAFLPTQSDFKMAQFLTSSHTMYSQFPKFGCFWAVKQSKSPNWVEKQLDCWLLCEMGNCYWLFSRMSQSMKLMKRIFLGTGTEKAQTLWTDRKLANLKN